MVIVFSITKKYFCHKVFFGCFLVALIIECNYSVFFTFASFIRVYPIKNCRRRVEDLNLQGDFFPNRIFRRLPESSLPLAEADPPLEDEFLYSAEEVRFELTRGFLPYGFSRTAPSATRPLLRAVQVKTAHSTTLAPLRLG